MLRWILAFVVLIAMAAVLLFFAGFFNDRAASPTSQVSSAQLDAEVREGLRQETDDSWQADSGAKITSPIAASESYQVETEVGVLAGETETGTALVEGATQAQPVVEQTAPTRLPPEGNYTLSLGSFSSEANAIRYQTQLDAEGITTKVKHGKSGFWVVILDQGWATKSEAAAEQRRLKQAGLTTIIVWGFK
jgi:cell division protein FtsN